MDERQEKSILEMGRGAIMERADYEMRAMIRNILDPNTSAKAARKLNITLTFKPEMTGRPLWWSAWPSLRWHRPTPSPPCCTCWTKTRSSKWLPKSPVSWP